MGINELNLQLFNVTELHPDNNFLNQITKIGETN